MSVCLFVRLYAILCPYEPKVSMRRTDARTNNFSQRTIWMSICMHVTCLYEPEGRASVKRNGVRSRPIKRVFHTGRFRDELLNDKQHVFEDGAKG